MTNFCAKHQQFYADYCVYCGLFFQTDKLIYCGSCQTDNFTVRKLKSECDNPKDKKIIRECLNYCYHRIKNHGSFIPVWEQDIDRIRKQL